MTMYYANTFYDVHVFPFDKHNATEFFNIIYVSNSFLFGGTFSAITRTTCITATFSVDSFKEFILIFG